MAQLVSYLREIAHKFVFFMFVFISVPIFAQIDLGQTWDIKQLNKNNSHSIALKDKKGRVLKRVSSSQINLINKVFNDIASVSELDARLILVSGNQPNAFAGPIGGRRTVGVNFGMLDMLDSNASEWAAVLGHEMAHLKLDHYKAGLKRKIPLQILSAVIRSKTDHYETIRDADIVMKLVDTKFSRDQERSSDYLGAIWAVESGYNVWGSVKAHEKLRNYSSNSTLPFFRTHPTGRERVKTLTGLAERLGGKKLD
jgi:predicted Zn-dependent protease